MDLQSDPSSSTSAMHHTSVVLFYKYFLSSSSPSSSSVDDDCSLFRLHASHYVERLIEHQKQLCSSLKMRGRILLGAEGINGTLSALDSDDMQKYVDTMKSFNLVRDLGPPPTRNETTASEAIVTDSIPGNHSNCGLFSDIDWKFSSVSPELASRSHIFPDLKVSAVKEIVATGGLSIDDIPTYGGKHLSPEEFHNQLIKGGKDLILIDVRNTFEYDIGHFVNPSPSGDGAESAVVSNNAASSPAINPEMTNFTQFDAQFCARNADKWKDKKVLMYCTGGIRCEKASAMMRKRGIDDVSQLSGGIHRYLEKYGDAGLFRGKNFTFDLRVAIDPKECLIRDDESLETGASDSANAGADKQSATKEIVGKCLECNVPYDTISGSRVCTVCRDLVLVCPTCTKKLRELHCARHSGWKQCYFTFLEVFSADELAVQLEELTKTRDGLVPPAQHKAMRRTLNKQIEKVTKRIKALKNGEAKVEKDAKRRCRTCAETEDMCDGLCWGFWKRGGCDLDRKRTSMAQDDGNDVEGHKKQKGEDIQPIAVGDIVEPGQAWNELRLGPKSLPDGSRKFGRVVEIKSWGSLTDANDCVAVVWNETNERTEAAQPKIYRWGALALNGKRMYDVQRCQKQVA